MKRVGVRENLLRSTLEEVVRATAGMATSRPTPSQQELRQWPPSQSGAPSLPPRLSQVPGLLAELVEGHDDADDGSEQSDEGRVVAQGSEIGEPTLQAHSLKGRCSTHGFFGRPGPAIRLHEACDHDGRLGARRGLHPLDGAFEISVPEQPPQLPGELGEVVADE